MITELVLILVGLIVAVPVVIGLMAWYFDRKFDLGLFD